MEGDLMDYLKTQYAIYLLIALFGLGVGKNLNQSFDEDLLAKTVAEQLEGKLSANANAIAEFNESLNMVKSQMVSHEELQDHAKNIISTLGDETENRLKDHMEKTNAKVDLISRSFRTLRTQIKKGFITIGDEIKKEDQVEPPPDTWDGMKKEDYQWCLDSPTLCDPFKLTLGTSYQVDGFPVALFKSKNLWDKDFNLDLNLLFDVTAITLREDPDDPKSGVVRNQGIYIKAGYVDSKGQFISLAEDKLYKGQKGFDPQIFYSPTQVFKPKKYDLFDPALLIGSSYRIQGGEFGLAIGASLLNFFNAQLRLGGTTLIESEYFGVGGMVSYHYLFGRKHLNIAPFGSYVFGIANPNDVTLGVKFQVW